jgi:cytochrome c553
MKLSHLIAVTLLALPGLRAADTTELFEKNARPLFVEKCQACHNAKLKSGGIDFSSVDGLKQAASAGFFGAPSDPDKSPLLQALAYESRIKMPPQGKLPAERIAGIREWLAAGATLPAAPAATSSAGSGGDTGTGLRPVALRGIITDADKNFWAFKPNAHHAPPPAPKNAVVDNPIDRFILANLEKNGLHLAPPASKLVLIRRATFDLTGLPPTEKEIADFLADKSPNAFEKLVDRLLASPRYGERWGRQWLDVMRYADSTGSDEDHRYPHAWRFRDYVVKAFNDDMPYNEFVRQQLAGDILASQPNSGVGYEGIVATGFLALGKKALAQKDLPLKRYDVVDDQIDVTAKAFMGLTITCARCHDHKFDPIATKDYYQMAAIFASTLSYEKGEDGDPVQTPLAAPGAFEAFKKSWTTYLGVEKNIAKIVDFDKEAKKARDKEEALIASNMLAPAGKWAAYLNDKTRPELAGWRAATPATREAVAKEYQEEFRRAAYQYDQNLSWWKTARSSYPNAGKVAGPKPEVDPKTDPFFYAVWADPKGPAHLSQDEMILALKPEQQTSVRKLLAEIAELEKTLPTKEIPMATAVKEGPTMDQKVFLRGDYHNLGDPVERTVPSILRVSAPAPPVSTASGRLELANWIVDPRNPLPSRVMANRIWQGHFGDGIVRTPDNFGKLGERPSNPELLDYLATRFVEGGWSIKKMQRLIMLSKTYQQSAEYDAATKAKDPDNRLLARFPRQRLSIEEIRDAFLYIGGDLDLTMGGTLDPGVGTDGETSSTRISMNPESTNRRSIYLPLRRSNLPTLYMLFDFGDATSPEGHRNPTTVATQALFVMNSPLVQREAKALSDRILKQNKKDSARIDEAYLAILDRHADPTEIDKALSYINTLGEAKGWQSFCHALMASNEFIYVY